MATGRDIARMIAGLSDDEAEARKKKRKAEVDGADLARQIASGAKATKAKVPPPMTDRELRITAAKRLGQRAKKFLGSPLAAPAAGVRGIVSGLEKVLAGGALSPLGRLTVEGALQMAGVAPSAARPMAGVGATLAGRKALGAAHAQAAQVPGGIIPQGAFGLGEFAPMAMAASRGLPVGLAAPVAGAISFGVPSAALAYPEMAAGEITPGQAALDVALGAATGAVLPGSVARLGRVAGTAGPFAGMAAASAAARGEPVLPAAGAGALTGAGLGAMHIPPRLRRMMAAPEAAAPAARPPVRPVAPARPAPKPAAPKAKRVAAKVYKPGDRVRVTNSRDGLVWEGEVVRIDKHGTYTVRDAQGVESPLHTPDFMEKIAQPAAPVQPTLPEAPPRAAKPTAPAPAKPQAVEGWKAAAAAWRAKQPSSADLAATDTFARGFIEPLARRLGHKPWSSAQDLVAGKYTRLGGSQHGRVARDLQKMDTEIAWTPEGEPRYALRGTPKPANLLSKAQVEALEAKAAPKPAAPTAKPAAAPEPGRTLRIGRGEHGQVAVVFPDQAHADLFSYAGRLRRETTRPTEEGAALLQRSTETGAKLGIGREQFGGAATQYRDSVIQAIRGLPEGDTYQALPFKAAAPAAPKPTAPAAKGFRVVEEEGYVKVLRGTETIAAGTVDKAGKVQDFEFLEERFRKSNSTRLAALRALEAWQAERPAAPSKAVEPTPGTNTDDDLMVRLMRSQKGTQVDIAAAGELRRRGIVAEEDGMIVPTPKGRAVWDNAVELVAQERVQAKPPAPAAPPKAQPPALKPTAPAAEGAKPERGEGGWFGEVATKDLRSDPQRFQYKAGMGKAGAGPELRQLGRYDPEKGGVILVWRDPANGETFVVNGHHRLELARRTGQQSLLVRYLDAPTEGEARLKGSLVNIAEGRGTPQDAAKVFRDSGVMDPKALGALGVSVRGNVAGKGLALARLDLSLFNRVVQGRLSESRGVLIGEMLPEVADQVALMKLLDKAEARGRKISDDTVAELIRDVKGAETEAVTTQTLWGEETIRQSNALEKAELAAWVRERLGRDKRLFGFVSKAGRAEELRRAGNVIDAERSGRIATEAGVALEVFDRLAHTKGPISATLNAAASELMTAPKGKQDAIRQRLYDGIQEAVSETLRGGAAEGPGGPPAAEGRGRFRAGEAARVTEAPTEVATEADLVRREYILEGRPAGRDEGVINFYEADRPPSAQEGPVASVVIERDYSAPESGARSAYVTLHREGLPSKTAFGNAAFVEITRLQAGGEGAQGQTAGEGVVRYPVAERKGGEVREADTLRAAFLATLRRTGEARFRKVQAKVVGPDAQGRYYVRTQAGQDAPQRSPQYRTAAEAQEYGADYLAAGQAAGKYGGPRLAGKPPAVGAEGAELKLETPGATEAEIAAAKGRARTKPLFDEPLGIVAPGTRAAGELVAAAKARFEPTELALEARGLVKTATRKAAAETSAAFRRAQNWTERLSEAELENIGAVVEGTGTLRIKGDTAEAARQRLTPEQRRVLTEYRKAQEEARQGVNDYLRGINEEDYIKFLDNYLPHFYMGRIGKRDVLTTARNRFLRHSPNAKQRKIPTLAEAVEYGLVPVTQNVSKLHRMWAETNWRVATNRIFVAELRNIKTAEGERVIQKTTKAPPDWVHFDHPAIAHVYGQKVKGGKTVLWRGGAKVHPEVAPAVRMMLQEPFGGRWWRGAEMFNAFAKKAALSFTLFHHAALTESSQAVLARWFNPLRGMFVVGERHPVTAKRELLRRPHRLGVDIMKQPELLRDPILHGLQVERGVIDIPLTRVSRALATVESRTQHVPLLNKVTQRARQFNEWWDERLWGRYHSGLKVFAYYDLVGKAMGKYGPDTKANRPPAEIKEAIASHLNDAFGGQEWAAKFQLPPRGLQIARLAFLAPDWTLSNLRIFAGTFTRDPMLFRHQVRYWRNMILTLLGSATALQRGIHTLRGDDEDHKAYPWENEVGHKWDIDVTPIVRHLPWHDPKDKSRYYTHFGKQAREVLNWAQDPLAVAKRKASPLVKTAFEIVVAKELGGFDMHWQEAPAWSVERARGMLTAPLKQFVPFSVRGNNFAFTAPMAKGMTRWKTQRAIEKALREYAQPTMWRKFSAFMHFKEAPPAYTAKLGVLVGDIFDAAKLNGVDGQKAGRQALAQVRGEYYRRFFIALEKGDEAEMERTALAVVRLHGGIENLKRSAKARGLDLTPEEKTRAVGEIRRARKTLEVQRAR